MSILIAQNCTDIEINGGAKKIDITGLTAPIEIVQVFDENYNIVFRCEGGDCGAEQMISDLTEGLYRVNIQFYDADWQLICQTPTQDVTVLPDDDGSTGGDCDNLTAVGGEGKIDISGLTAPIEIVQVFDANYNIVFRCEGGDCGNGVTVDNLSEGLYRVNTQYYKADWQLICTAETVEVNVSAGNDMPDCSDVRVVGGESSVTIEGLTAPFTAINVSSPGFSTIRCRRDDDCGEDENKFVVDNLEPGAYTVRVIFYNESGSFACETSNFIVQVNPDIINPPSCNDVEITTAAGQIIVNNLNARAIVKVFTQSYEPVYECVDGDCTYPTQIINLPPDFYNISIDLRDDNFNSVCLRRNEPITVPGSGCDLPDYPALIALYNATKGEEWNRRWNLGDCNICNWEGVTCNANGRVTELNLNGFGLNGELPAELADLPALTKLDVGQNFRLSGCFPLGLCGRVEVNAANIRTLPFEGDFAQACSTGLGFQDSDGDGICDSEDCNDNDPNFPMTEGSLCDDGNPNTTRDIIQPDGCTCRGDAPDDVADCSTISINSSNNQLTISNLDAPRYNVFVFKDNRFTQSIFRCLNCSEETVRLTNLQAGPYEILIQYRSFSDNAVCELNMTVSVTSTDCNSIDKDAMVAIFDSLNGANWIEKWPVADCNPCGWFGVTCNDEGRVTEIALPNNRLAGNIPTQIGQLTALQKLNFQGLSNFFSFSGSTSTIPASIGQLKELTHLNLSNSRGYSRLPKEIGQLTKLKELNLFRAYFWGGIPEEIGNLTQLEILNLGFTYYSSYGPTPTAALSNLQNLKELNLTSTGINEVPTYIFDFPKLETLNLSENSIAGSLPNELWDIQTLTTLELNNNPIAGPIATNIGNLINLERLNLSSTSITSLPSTTGNLRQLSFLNLSNNRVLTALPKELGNLQKLRFFGLRFSGVEGEIPKEWSSIGDESDFVAIDLRSNRFTGCFPAELDAWCADKYSISLSGNAFISGCNFTTFCADSGLVDADGDGLFSGDDCDDNNPNLPTTPRTACDDGNPNTTDDLIQLDGCTCLGIDQNAAPSCDLLQFFGENGQLEIRGINTGSIHLKIFNNAFSEILFECFFNCEERIVFPYPSGGFLNVEVQIYDTNESLLCDRKEGVRVFRSGSQNRATAKDLIDIQLFPNPVKEELTLQTTTLNGQTGRLQIFNAFGQQVLAQKTTFNGDYETINAQNLENGIYWLVVQIDNRKLITKRFIKEDWR